MSDSLSRMRALSLQRPRFDAMMAFDVVKLPFNLTDGLRSVGGTWSLRARLVLLVIVTMSPLLLLGLVVQYTQYVGDKEVAS